MAPKISWPWPPMLNRPTRSGSTTARPVSTSGAVFCRVRVQAARHEQRLLDQRLVRVQRGHALQADQHRADGQGDDQRDDDDDTALVGEQERQRLPVGTPAVRTATRRAAASAAACSATVGVSDM